MSLLVVGSVAFDALESPYGKVERALGGAATYFAVAASFFTPVNLVAIVGDDFTAEDEKIFRGRHIDTEGLERATGKTFFWAGRYSQNLNERVTLATELNVFADFKPRLPEKYRASQFVFLANIAPELQRDVLHQVKKRPKIAALDTMNYWIERSNAELRETLKHVDILMINDSETRELSSEHNLLRAARHIFKMGPSTLVVKRGEYGAMLVDKRGVFCVPAFPLEEPHDPTGAGDSFAGGFMGYLAGNGEKSDAALRRAMVFGSVLGSFAVEQFGLDRLRRLKRSEIHARARHFSKLTQFKL
ncbi:MAG: sugar kinase [Acidobacteria bacterium 13_2_20CM_2_57_6]|nr:MAG: sugar kinase [Acidobacteria bacterium 13_2_20CM_2_57_6]PYT41343.1 MAG: sugar kinase [Acidobacteriota bacterium]PYT44699.1 MAG: sugar kinase [Acidobacteriota bacterium]